jgi:photosynthetic reaction center cytochrome c subunit
MSRYAVFAVVVLGLAASARSMIAAQQSPFKPLSNLRVLPRDTKLAEIIPIMKSFTQALGVRCQFCHSYTGSDPNALENFDFAGDAVPAKATARRMMTLAQAVNSDLLNGVGEPVPAGQSKVTCYTCHRGERAPQTAPGPSR